MCWPFRTLCFSFRDYWAEDAVARCMGSWMKTAPRRINRIPISVRVHTYAVTDDEERVFCAFAAQKDHVPSLAEAVRAQP